MWLRSDCCVGRIIVGFEGCLLLKEIVRVDDYTVDLVIDLSHFSIRVGNSYIYARPGPFIFILGREGVEEKVWKY